MDQETVFHEDPAAQAEIFRSQGFGCVHVVDLDGAVAGRSVNGAAVESILSCGLPVQLGGGIRTPDAVADWLRKGVKRVVLGTAAPTLMREVARSFSGQVAVALDLRGHKVATQGWLSTSSRPQEDFLAEGVLEGAAAVIFTDIERDGIKAGVDLEHVASLARGLKVPLIASGGVAGLADLRGLAAVAPPLQGVIVGRALYDGDIEPAEALRICPGGAPF